MSKFSNRYWVVIPAAGIGKRMGGEIPKQYLDLHGKPILMRTLGIFLTNDLVTELVVAIAPGDQYWPSIAKQIKDQRVITIEGGGERCQSVLNGLYALSEKAADNDWVLVHDAVRPCLSQEALHRLFAHLSDHPTGGLLGCPLSDTLKRTDDQGSVLETLDRSHVWQAQTPQMFRYGLLKAALERAITNNQMVTDEASAIELMGCSPPKIILGHRENIKVTRQEDMAWAQNYWSNHKTPEKFEASTQYSNEFNQAVSYLVENWQAAKRPEQEVLKGEYCSLVLMDAHRHGSQLFENLSMDNRGESWTYLPYGPFVDSEAFCAWIKETQLEEDTQLYAILNESAEPIGVAGYLRINPDHGVIEVGHLHYSKLLQRTPAATEAMYLMMQYAFEGLGYRRYEWKCHSLNEASRRAALRLGFQFEGVFRQCNVFKERNRDTAWFSIIDSEWPGLKEKFEKWLDKDNFDEAGKQRVSLQIIKS